MSLDRIYKILTVDAIWQNDPDLPLYNPQPPQSVLIATDVTNSAYLVGEAGFTDWDALTSTIVGSWDSSTGLQEGESYDTNEPPNVIGTPTHPVTIDYATWIRPLGNESGIATGLLDSMRWAGHREEKFLLDDFRYTAADAPFTLRFTREAIGIGALAWDSLTQYFTGDFVTHIGSTWVASQDSLNQSPFGGSAFWDLVSAPGWGWKAEVLSDDPLRDITARAIAIYSDPAWTAFLYTTGAFSLDGTTGLYTAVCPPGNRTATPDPVYYSLLWGSIQEGNWQHIDPADLSTEDRLHWAGDQGQAGFFGVVDNSGPTPVITDAEPAQTIYSPDGFAVVDINAPSSALLTITLIGNAQDTLDPVLTIHFPDGTQVINFTWNMPNTWYRSSVTAGIEAKILSYAGYKLWVELDWA